MILSYTKTTPTTNKRLSAEIITAGAPGPQFIRYNGIFKKVTLEYKESPSKEPPSAAEKVIIGQVVNDHVSETLSEARDKQKALIKSEYMNNILWTDDLRQWYDKLVYTLNRHDPPETPSQDDTDKYNVGMDLWNLAQIEYNNKKNTIYSETDIVIIKQVVYTWQE